MRAEGPEVSQAVDGVDTALPGVVEGGAEGVMVRVVAASTLCCAVNGEGIFPESKELPCSGTARICRHFYDSAPSGTYGTMSYLVKSCCVVLDAIPNEGDLDCQVS